MPVATKLIRTRIRAVKNTRKITKAMELVAASKMRKATEAAVQGRPYSTAAEGMLQRLQGRVELPHPLLREPAAIKNELLVVVTSDRGLCGGLNANVIREALAHIQETQAQGITVSVVTVGKKSRAPLAKRGVPIIADFTDITQTVDFLRIKPIADIALEEFKTARADKVTLLYTEFQSALIQRTVRRAILPLSGLRAEQTASQQSVAREYLFEPSPDGVYAELLPRFLETQVYRALLEAIASEHSARMLAMRNASDAADEITQDLTLTYNQARQAGITQELAEIAGGAAALA
ncbi:MAG: ATP synthase F1 subunit gamma [Patescibacteria group bacterium]